MFLKFSSAPLIFNSILLISFSVSVNTFVEIEYINIIFYVFFHLTFIYFLFYHYHYSFYLLSFLYGIFYDILLLDIIGTHLFCLTVLVSLYILFKKYLFLLSSYQVSITILISLISILFLELIFAFLFNNIYFTFLQMAKFLIFSLIIFFPSIYIFNRLDR